MIEKPYKTFVEPISDPVGVLRYSLSFLLESKNLNYLYSDLNKLDSEKETYKVLEKN